MPDSGTAPESSVDASKAGDAARIHRHPAPAHPSCPGSVRVRTASGWSWPIGRPSTDSARPSETGARRPGRRERLRGGGGALAHSVGGVEGAYFRSDLFERRRALMESWGAFLAE